MRTHHRTTTLFSVLALSALALAGCKPKRLVLGDEKEGRMVDALAVTADGSATLVLGRAMHHGDERATPFLDVRAAGGKLRASRSPARSCLDAILLPVAASSRFVFVGSCQGPTDLGQGTLPPTPADEWSHVVVAVLDGTTGAPAWSHGFGSTGAPQFAFGAALSPSGSSIVLGGNYSGAFDAGLGALPPVSPRAARPYLMAVDTATGKTQWAKALDGGEHREAIQAVTFLPDDDLLVAGTFWGKLAFPTGPVETPEAGRTGMYLARFAKTGEPKWGAVLPVSSSGRAFQQYAHLATTASGNVVLVAEASDEVLAAGVDPASGKLTWERRVKGAGMLGTHLAVDPAGNAYVAIYAGAAGIDFGRGPVQGIQTDRSASFVLQLDPHGAVTSWQAFGSGINEAVNAIAWSPARKQLLVALQRAQGPSGKRDSEWRIGETWMTTVIESAVLPKR